MFLLENSRHYTDTIYLGGYAVECALKCLIFERTAKEKHRALSEDLGSGSLSHNFDYLAHRLRSIDVAIPTNIQKSLLVLTEQWSTDLRYSGALISRSLARTFIDHVQTVVEWIQRSR